MQERATASHAHVWFPASRPMTGARFPRPLPRPPFPPPISLQTDKGSGSSGRTSPASCMWVRNTFRQVFPPESVRTAAASFPTVPAGRKHLRASRKVQCHACRASHATVLHHTFVNKPHSLRGCRLHIGTLLVSCGPKHSFLAVPRQDPQGRANPAS